MIIFGVRSPLIVEYEETCHRLGMEISACVSVTGNSRALDQARVMEIDQFDREKIVAPFLSCAFSPQRRQALTDMGLQRNLPLAPALIDPTAIVARSIRIGDGSFVNAGVVIAAVSLVGQNVLVNRSVSIGHHALIEDFVSIGPGVTLAGNVHVGAGSIIGAGTTILPHIRIGAGAIVGAGSLVRDHVPDQAFVVGNPAKQRAFDARRSSLNVDGEE